MWEDGEFAGEYCFLSLARGGDWVGVDPRGREVPLRARGSFYSSLGAAVEAAERHERAREQRSLSRRMRRRYERA